MKRHTRRNAAHAQKRAKRTRKTKKKMLYNILTAIAAGIIAGWIILALLEVYLQLTYIAPLKEPFAIDNTLGWSNKKGLHTSEWSQFYGHNITAIHNSDGIRSEKEFSIEKTKPRIMIIGDSFVYGMGLDQKDIIGQRLQELMPDYEIISAGTTGYSSLQYLQYYQSVGKKYHPDIVVFVVYINDFAENSFYSIFGYTKPTVFVVDTEGKLHNQTRYSIDLAPDRDMKLQVLCIEFLTNAAKNIQQLIFKENYENSSYRMNQGWYMLEEHVTQGATYSLLVQVFVMKEAKNIMAADNVTFVVVYMPLQMQVDERNREEVLSRFSGMEKFPLNYSLVNKNMDEMHRRLKFAYLDFSTALEAQPNVSAAFLPDGHLSPTGTRLFDETLYAFLQNSNIILENANASQNKTIKSGAET